MQETKDLVVEVQASQQKIWGAIENISYDLQELAQKDAGEKEKRKIKHQ